jgi:hypothetical protein
MKHTVAFFLILAFFTPFASFANCKPLRKSMHAARKAVKACNKAWVDSLRGESVDPSDDCTLKQTEFVASVKEFKACLLSLKAKK